MAHPGPIVAASITSPPCPAIGPWVGPDYTVLGTDGFGRSEAPADLRRFFEVDAENIALAALERLARRGEYPKAKLSEAIQVLESIRTSRTRWGCRSFSEGSTRFFGRLNSFVLVHFFPKFVDQARATP